MKLNSFNVCASVLRPNLIPLSRNHLPLSRSLSYALQRSTKVKPNSTVNYKDILLLPDQLNFICMKKFCCATAARKENLATTDGSKGEENEPSSIGDGSWEEIYRGVLTTQFRLLKMFSIGSSVLGLSLQPMLYEQLGNANLGLIVPVAAFVGFFTFGTPLLIHYISKKYVTKLEYDSARDVYAATTLTFFLKEKKTHFKVDEVIRPDVPGMFSSFTVKETALFVDPHQFDDLDHYSRIMGYDQPIDFRPDSEKNKSRTK